MSEIRADRVKPGMLWPTYSYPSPVVEAVTKVDKPGWPEPWVKLIIRRPDGTLLGEDWPPFPPHWLVEVFPAVDYEDDDGQLHD